MRKRRSKALICCENYYLCQIKNLCDDREECHVFARAEILTEQDRYKPCRVIYDGGIFHYEFQTLPTYDFRAGLKHVQNRLKAWRNRSEKR